MLSLGLGWGSVFSAGFSSVDFLCVDAATVAAVGEATPATAAVMDSASCSLIPGAPAPGEESSLASVLGDPLAGTDDVPVAVKAGGFVSSGVSGLTLIFIAGDNGVGAAAAAALVAGKLSDGGAEVAIIRGCGLRVRCPGCRQIQPEILLSLLGW